MGFRVLGRKRERDRDEGRERGGGREIKCLGFRVLGVGSGVQSLQGFRFRAYAQECTTHRRGGLDLSSH